MNTISVWQLKDIAQYEEILLQGNCDIVLTSCITIKCAKSHLSKKPRIGFVYGPSIDYSLEKLNQILGLLYDGLTLEKHIENQNIRIQAAKERFAW